MKTEYGKGPYQEYCEDFARHSSPYQEYCDYESSAYDDYMAEKFSGEQLGDNEYEED